VGCEECDRLRSRRGRKERALAAASALLNVAALSSAAGEHLRFRARVQDAKVDLELAEMELQQHRKRHTLTAGGAFQPYWNRPL